MIVDIDVLRQKFAALKPELLELRDDSALHVGHAGAKEGGHFHVAIASAAFVGKTRLERHRLVNHCVCDLMQNGIHALAIDAMTPEESAEKNSVSEK